MKSRRRECFAVVSIIFILWGSDPSILNKGYTPFLKSTGWRAMGYVKASGVEVTDTETEIIGSTQVDADKHKIFVVQNGDNAIETKAYGSENGTDWTMKDMKRIEVNMISALLVEKNMCIYVKLSGRTLEPDTESIVTAILEW